MTALSAAVVAGAVVGSIIGLGLIVLFALHAFVYRKKKKDKQEEIANEIKWESSFCRQRFARAEGNFLLGQGNCPKAFQPVLC